jgi:hypothetical protein
LIVDEKKIDAFIKEKMKADLACEICGASDWGYTNVIFELTQFQGGQFQTGRGHIAPFFPVSCNSCGNTKFFNAINAGILDSHGRKLP